MGYTFGVVDLYIENHEGYDSLGDLCRALKQQFPPNESELRFNIEAGSICVSCPYDDPGYHIDEELEDLAAFLGPHIIVTGTAKLEDGGDIYYREIVAGQVICAHSEWIEKYSARFINKLENLAECLVEYTPEQFEQLQD